MVMDQNPLTMWKRMVFEGWGERESTIFVLKFDVLVNTDIYRPLWRLA